jgi:hypothetical protein
VRGGGEGRDVALPCFRDTDGREVDFIVVEGRTPVVSPPSGRRRICSGDAMAPTRSDDGSGFFEKHYDRVCRYARGMVRDSVEAEDLTQEAFLRAHRERVTVKDPGAMLCCLWRAAQVCIL